MKTSLLIILGVLFLQPCAVSGAPGPETLLRETVAAFWNAAEQGDRVTAMKHVHPDDLNTFLNSKPAAVGDWEIAEISINSESTEAEVRIEYALETYPGMPFNVAKIDTWQLIEDEWKIRVKSPSAAALEAFFGMTGSPAEANSGEKGLTVRPETVKFYKTNLNQPAFIWIENNLDTPAVITGIELDEGLIRIAEQPEEVPPGEKSRIRLQYIGEKPEQENLTTTITVEIKAGDKVLKQTITAVYNYMNDALRWIQQQQRPGGKPQP